MGKGYHILILIPVIILLTRLYHPSSLIHTPWDFFWQDIFGQSFLPPSSPIYILHLSKDSQFSQQTISRKKRKNGNLHNFPHHSSTPYCWWFRNPKQPPGMVLKPVVNSGISTTFPSTGDRRISAINSIIPSPSCATASWTISRSAFNSSPRSSKAQPFLNKPMVFVVACNMSW